MPKHGRDQFRAMPPEFPGREVIALPKGDTEEEFSCVTVYAAVPARSGLGGLVRINLFASLLNVRSFVASAIVPVNFTGPVISASGILADAYSVYLQATAPELEGYIALRADTCCAEPKVLVPVALQNPEIPEDQPVASLLVAEPMAPWQVTTGRYVVFTEVTTPGGVVTLGEGERVLSLALRSAALVNPFGTGPRVFAVQANEAGRLEPLGTMVGPGTLTFANFLHFGVETVR
jgi:hypothetical protein